MAPSPPSTSTSSSPTWQSCFRPNLFAGKVALVTGGGTGIGRAIATELAVLGATTVIASRNHDACVVAAQEMTAQLRPTGIHGSTTAASSHTVGRVIAGPSTSIRNEDEIKALVAFVIDTCGALDLLVNNAGGQFISPSADLSRNGFAAVVDTNLTGTFLTCREAYNQYMQAQGGSIVNITLGNRNGMPCMMHSGAARAGVENMTATLCTEWMDSNVRINCVRPGIVWTDSGFANYGPGVGEMFMERILPTLPARRLGTAQEISSAVVWLLSEGAMYVTGTVLAVDGGSAYTLLPLVEIDDTAHLQPVYGSLPSKARL